jgi:hypothetical protein
MPLSAIQKGAIGQFAFLAAALATGRGQIEVYTPAADNEGRDAEVRRHLRRIAGIGVQVKIAFGLSRTGGRRKYLAVTFSIPKTRLRNDPRLWYFIGLYDERQLRLLDPVFLIPSAVLHRLARRGKSKRGIQFDVVANLSPSSRDQWAPYRIALADLGKRLLEIIDQAPLSTSGEVSRFPVDGLLLSRATSGGTRQLRAAPMEQKYDLIRNAVLARFSLSALYEGHLRLFSPFVLGRKAGDPHVLAYQFGGTSHKKLAPDGSPENWRCLRVSELTELNLLPGAWHGPRKGRSAQHCIDQVDVSASRPSSGKSQVRRAA